MKTKAKLFLVSSLGLKIMIDIIVIWTKSEVYCLKLYENVKKIKIPFFAPGVERGVLYASVLIYIGFI